jgi:LytS/YehU family sensor histidine kinase
MYNFQTVVDVIKLKTLFTSISYVQQLLTYLINIIFVIAVTFTITCALFSHILSSAVSHPALVLLTTNFSVFCIIIMMDNLHTERPIHNKG